MVKFVFMITISDYDATNQCWLLVMNAQNIGTVEYPRWILPLTAATRNCTRDQLWPVSCELTQPSILAPDRHTKGTFPIRLESSKHRENNNRQYVWFPPRSWMTVIADYQLARHSNHTQCLVKLLMLNIENFFYWSIWQKSSRWFFVQAKKLNLDMLCAITQSQWINRIVTTLVSRRSPFILISF